MIGHWGWNFYAGQSFFLEYGRSIQKECPFSPPLSDCPHWTSGTPCLTQYTTDPAIYALPSRYELPNEIQLLNPASNVVYYVGTPTLRYVLPLMTETNYYPVVISGFKIDNQSFRFLDKLVNEIRRIGRSVVLEYASEFVLPPYIREIDSPSNTYT